MVHGILANKMKKQARTRVQTVECPKCRVEMYSRAVHDFHGCKCGVFVDGGFAYLHYGGYKNEPPKIRTRYVLATRHQLYEDWNFGINKFGFIKKEKNVPAIRIR